MVAIHEQLEVLEFQLKAVATREQLEALAFQLKAMLGLLEAAVKPILFSLNYQPLSCFTGLIVMVIGFFDLHAHLPIELYQLSRLGVFRLLQCCQTRWESPTIKLKLQ